MFTNKLDLILNAIKTLSNVLNYHFNFFMFHLTAQLAELHPQFSNLASCQARGGSVRVNTDSNHVGNVC